MFETTTEFLFFDEFRVPYRIVGADEGSRLGRGSWLRDGDRRSLYWPLEGAGSSEQPPFGRYRLGKADFFASLVADPAFRELLERHASGWTPVEPITTDDGREIAHVWRSDNGDIALPFDPNEAISACWSERYRPVSSGWLHRLAGPARRAYYGVRPLLPRAVQLGFRRLLVPLQERAAFPRWPIETSLHDLYDDLFRLVELVAGEPVPWLSPWPRGRTWALVLTHDVETEVGVEAIPMLRDIELELGVRSAWNFVPDRYPLDPSTIDDLRTRGFEIGVHGARHDGRDLASRKLLEERLPIIRRAAERWHALGFRSPATQRAWSLMPLLDFDYDSSYPDTDPYEPQPGGCCTWLPFFNRDLVELPLTMPQDHTLFVLLGHSDESLWLEKTEHLRRAGGMALLNTHPDYGLDGVMPRAYRNYLGTVVSDPDVWTALPAEVSAWWRRRAETTVERRNGAWQAEGPAAAEAEIRLGTA